MPNKIPFGYEVIGGKAFINEKEAEQLLLYYRRFLDGETMNAAAREARLPCSQTTYCTLLSKKVYLGTDYYPPIISKEYQDQLIAEYKKRRAQASKPPKKRPVKGVKVYTDFRLVRPRAYAPDDPVDCAAALYQRIRPKKNIGAPNSK